MRSRSLLFPAAVLLSLTILSGCGGESHSRGAPDVVMIMIDTIRPDRMSCNGHVNATTPVLDSLAGSGIVWTRVQAQSSWTLPAAASVLTGLSPHSHLCGYRDGELYGLDQALPTLPLQLSRGARYQTAAFFNSSLLGIDFGFSSGFDHFQCSGTTGKDVPKTAGETVDDLIRWVDGRDSGRPFFAAVHLADTRLPYDPPPPYDTLFTQTKVDPVFNRFWGTERDMAERDSYAASMDSVQLAVLEGLHDGEMAYLDAQIGRLLLELRARVDMNNLMLVVVGLHGEEFLDHGGLGHGSSLYQELLSVPLIIVGPGIAQDVRTDLVSQMDIYPSLLTYAGVSVPIWLDGADILMSDSLPADRIVPSESVVWSEYDLLALRMQDKVVIGNPRQETPLIYDLAQDPKQIAGMQAGRDTRDQLYYHWSLPSRGNPARLDSVLCTPMGIRDLCYVH